MFSLKHRPFSFDEMVGQKGILSEMRKRSSTMSFPEVMIMSGPSGVGKTTLAFIIAALLNDPDPIKNEDGSFSPNPESVPSASILNEKFSRDVSFYDASSMGKDDVLKLENIVSSAPMFDKNRVVIIDEAQELSKAGKGVTLKLLEKKRSNAFIILCTMDIDAFDKAVKSRGQLYTFRNPTAEEIANHLFQIVEKEDVNPPDEFFTDGLLTLAENCEGSVRFAVQNLERCLAGEFYTSDSIEKELGFLSNGKLTSMILKLLNKDGSVIKEILDFSAKDFFYKASKTLTDAYIYLKSGYISADWKKGFATSVEKYNLTELIDVLMDVSQEKYFREDSLIYALAKYMDKTPPVIQFQEKPKEINTRTPVRTPTRVPVK